MTHFCMRFMTRARPSKPSACQPTWAARPMRGELGDALGGEVGDVGDDLAGGRVLDGDLGAGAVAVRALGDRGVTLAMCV